MNAKLKAQILDSLPKGISLKRDNALWIKKSKKYRHNGEDKEKTLTHTVKLGITPEMTDAKAREQFEKQLASAVLVRNQMVEKLASRKFLETDVAKTVGEGTLQQVFDMLNDMGTWKGKHQQLVQSYFQDTMNFFAERENKKPMVKDLHTSEWTLLEFKEWCAKAVVNRKMNMYKTVNTNSVNKRLGVWRQITAYAIKKRLFSLSDTLDPSKKNFGIEDEKRNQSKPKPPLSIEQEENLFAVIREYEDSFWEDCLTVAIDTGVRHDGELNKICTDWIDFGKRTLTFKRPKTQTWSTIPLTKRAFEVFKRRREVALKDENNRFFPVSKSSIRHNWDKYRVKAGLTADYTPYCTRHTFITRLVEAGVSPKAVMDLAGHGAIETTLTFYTHSTNEILETAISSLEEYKDKKKVANMKPVNGAVGSSLIGHNSRKVLKK